MTTLDNQEIKGLTNRLLIGIIVCTITITGGGLGFYYGLMAKIDKVSETQATRKVESDMHFKNIEDKIDNIKEDVQEIKEDKK